jgi:nucleotide-binding universal stress UspA family protein
MITFQHILFPVDFSARCAAAAPSVIEMAQRFGAQITVLHVVDLPSARIAPPEASAWSVLVGAERLREQGLTALESFIARAFPGCEVKSEAAEGDPAFTIVEFAGDGKADLIMLPTTGLGAFRRMLLGSVTAKVLHDSAAPVWTGVHAQEMAAHPPQRWKRMLCAVEDERRDLPVVQWAAEFAAEQHMELRLVHAVRGPEDCEDNPGFRAFLLKAGRERMDKLQAAAGTDFELCLQVGSAGQVIHRAVIGQVADLVVIGRGVIQKPLGRLRSGAYEIIREAPCPVISV